MTPQQHVERVSERARSFLNAYHAFQAEVAEYNAMGGGSAYTSYLAGGTPFTQAEFSTAISSVSALKTHLDTGHLTNFVKIAGR